MPSRSRDNRCSSLIGLGRSSRRERSRREMPNSAHAEARPLAREFSVGQAPQGAEPPATRSCARGRPRARCAGFGRSHGRARRSHWLQKSMSGVWPIGPRGEEPPDHSKGLAHPRESEDERKSVGSRLDGGKAARTVAGLEVVKAISRHSSMEGALGRESHRR